MKICHLVHSFPPFSCGGTETYVLALAQAQAAGGHHVLVVSGTEKTSGVRETRRDIVEGVPVIFLSWMPSAYACDTTGLSAQLVLQDLFRQEEIQLAHVHHWHCLTMDLVATARGSGVPAVVSLHDYFVCCPRFFRLREDRTICPPEVGPQWCRSCCESLLPGVDEQDFRDMLEHRQRQFHAELSGAHTVLALSSPEKTYLDRVPEFDTIDVQVLPLPRPAMTPIQPGPRTGDTNGQLRLVSWGGLVPGKGLDVVVDACESSRHPERFSLDHFGRILEPAFQRTLQDRARHMTLRFPGRFATEEMAHRFVTYDLAVFPSFYMETHGFVVDEALSLGLPLVVSDRGALGDRIGGRGRVFPAGDVPALRQILEELLENPAALASLRDAPAPPPITMSDHWRELEAIYRQAVEAV